MDSPVRGVSKVKRASAGERAIMALLCPDSIISEFRSYLSIRITREMLSRTGSSKNTTIPLDSVSHVIIWI